MAKQGALLRSCELAAGLAGSASELSSSPRQARFAALELPGLHGLFPHGLKPGTITQVEGRRSSGRSTLAAHILAQATCQGQVCAVVDVQNHLHPASLQYAGVCLDHLLWVRCHGNADHAMRSADLLLHAGGFGVVWLDLCETPPVSVQRIPLSYWFRFRRALENTPTSLLVSADVPCAKSCVATHLQLRTKALHWQGNLLGRVSISATLQKNAETHPLTLQRVV